MRSDAVSPTGSDVVVVGGGLQGLSSALHLARSGCSVRLLESDYCGRHASGVNAGGVRTVARHLAEVPLSIAARSLWHCLSDLLGQDAGFVPAGQLKLAETPQELEILRRSVQQLQALGYTHEVLIGPEDVRELVPTLTPSITGAIWAADDGYAYPFSVVTAFRQACERLGVDIREGSPVNRIDHVGERWHVHTPAGRFESRHLVNTAGAWAGEIARQVGEPVPIEAGGLMLMVTTRVPQFVRPVLGTAGRSLSFKQFADGTVVIGGGLRCAADPMARHSEVDVTKLAPSARTVTDLFPHLRGFTINRAWAGVEGFMPDQIPVISLSRTRPNLVHAFGFSAHGFALSPIVGQIVAELVHDGRSTLPIEPFAIDRFAVTPAPSPTSLSNSGAAVIAQPVP